MSADKYPSIFSRQMETIVYISYDILPEISRLNVLLTQLISNSDSLNLTSRLRPSMQSFLSLANSNKSSRWRKSRSRGQTLPNRPKI